MKTLVLSIGMSILGMLPLSAQLTIVTSATPSCLSPNCNGIVSASITSPATAPISWTIAGSSNTITLNSMGNSASFYPLCPDNYTLVCQDASNAFGYTVVSVPVVTVNLPTITSVTYAPAPNPPYQAFQYIATVTYTGGTAPYTITWYNYSTIPPSVIATHTTNNLQDTISLYPGDYGVTVSDQTPNPCGSSASTYTFSICDNLVGTSTATVFGAIASSGNSYTVCANTTFTVDYIPIPNAPVNMILPIVTASVCPSGSPNFTCSLPANTHEYMIGQWFYSQNCSPVGVLMIDIYADACLYSPTFNLNNQFTLYPNPVKDKLHIPSTSSIDKIECYDALGNKVFEIMHPDKNINLHHLPNGVYFIKIYSDKSINNQKIILQKE